MLNPSFDLQNIQLILRVENCDNARLLIEDEIAEFCDTDRIRLDAGLSIYDEGSRFGRATRSGCL